MVQNKISQIYDLSTNLSNCWCLLPLQFFVCIPLITTGMYDGTCSKSVGITRLHSDRYNASCFSITWTMDPTINGLITWACLWSHHDRRHLKMCILMSTFMRHDNVDYVITNRHWQKDHLLHFEFISLKWHFRIHNLIESQLMRSSEPEVMKMCVIWDWLLQKCTLVDMHLTLPNGEKYMSSTIPSHHNPGIMCRISLKLKL